jgi:hypothetical protein
MFKSLRVPANLFKVVMWIVSFVFASFLVGLGGSLVADLPKLEDRLSVEQFADPAALERARTEQRELRRRGERIGEQRAAVQLEVMAAGNAYEAAREGFENWLATRKATSDPTQDPEVVARTRELDRLKTLQAEAQARLDALAQESLAQTRDLQRAADAENQLLDDARSAYGTAQLKQELRVFAARLALTLPLLVIAGWMVAKKRQSDYWPLYRGFIVFAAFTFFVELVPYLPSYGGYVRSIVGIVATVIGGHYAIKAMRRYLARREEAAAQTEEQRRKGLGYEEAIRKMSAQVCPGCERAILPGAADAAVGAPAKGADAGAVATASAGRETNFCVHCGMRLFSRCAECQTRKNAFFHFCPTCGADAGTRPAPEST